MALPLEGIKVVEFANAMFAPGGVQYLADQGAEVIKIEPPGGDDYRTQWAIARMPGMSKSFAALHRNKRSAQVDLAKPESAEILTRMVKWADVFVTNVRVKARRASGIAYEQIKPLNPALIYVSVTGYGERGPHCNLPAVDLNVQARAGIAGLRRYPNGVPVTPATMICDMSGGMMLAYSVMLALWQRTNNGAGQKIELSLLGQALAMEAQQLVRVEGDTGPAPGSSPTAFYTCYRCQDNTYLHVLVSREHQWQKLCQLLELPSLAADPEYSSRDKRQKHSADLYPVLEAIFQTKPRSEWLKLLWEADIPTAPVMEQNEVYSDPQVQANQLMEDVDWPGLGKVALVGRVFKLSGNEGEPAVRTVAPALGQHTYEVLREFGFAEGDIQRLEAAGVIKGTKTK